MGANGKSPRVSVVVPAYNSARFLGQTIDSILAQDYGDYEIIVADHSSSDGTVKVIERYAGNPALKVLSPTPKGGGALVNWNRVTRHARGELLKLVCGDDLIAPRALSRQVAAFDLYPSAVLVASRRSVIGAAGNVILRRRGLAGLSGLVSGRAAIRAGVRAGANIFGEPACVMMKRNILDAVGGWDSRFPYLIDQATYTRIMARGDMVALPEVLATFRVSGGQWSVRLARDQASQIRAFHAALRSEYSDMLSPMDVMVGNLRAVAISSARRLLYTAMSMRFMSRSNDERI